MSWAGISTLRSLDDAFRTESRRRRPMCSGTYRLAWSCSTRLVNSLAPPLEPSRAGAPVLPLVDLRDQPYFNPNGNHRCPRGVSPPAQRTLKPGSSHFRAFRIWLDFVSSCLGPLFSRSRASLQGPGRWFAVGRICAFVPRAVGAAAHGRQNASPPESGQLHDSAPPPVQMPIGDAGQSG